MSTLPSAGAFTARVKATDKCMRLALAYAKARDHYNHMSWDDPVAHSAASTACTPRAMRSPRSPATSRTSRPPLSTRIRAAPQDHGRYGVRRRRQEGEGEGRRMRRSPLSLKRRAARPGRPKMTDAQRLRPRKSASASRPLPKNEAEEASKKPTAKKPAAKPSAQHRGPGRPKKDGRDGGSRTATLSKSATKSSRPRRRSPRRSPSLRKPANKNQLAQSVPMGAAA